jgi:YHS domain-containing protein
MSRKTTINLAFAFAIACAMAVPAFAEDEVNVSNGLTLDGVPLALHGFDPVALSTLNTAARGSATHAVQHEGVSYYFASQISADTFKADPARYLPQYGGFCAFAVALGKKLDGDPRFADIVDGKLYLFVNQAVYEKYKADPQATITKAEEVWPTIHHTAIGSL